jgi:hypothetical protein
MMAKNQINEREQLEMLAIEQLDPWASAFRSYLL